MFGRDTKSRGDGVKQSLPCVAEDELEFAQFDWSWGLTPEHRAANLATTSMAIAMTSSEREEYLLAARSELQQICDAAGQSLMPIRHQASCTRWTPTLQG